MTRISIFRILVAALILGVVFVIGLVNILSSRYKFDAPTTPGASLSLVEEKKNKYNDISPQTPLENPPKIINAIYLTSWSASSMKMIDYVLRLKSTTEINAVVIDIKDYTGLVAYDTDVEAVNLYKTEEVRLPRINTLIKKLHDAGIYVIARLAVFQDVALAEMRPDLGVQSKIRLASSTPSKQTLWRDRKNLAWADPSSREVWSYNVSIAKDAALRGFDEINFDYIRFPSDGTISDMYFPSLTTTSSPSEVIRKFFAHLRSELPNIKISADLFGLTTFAKDDLGIGQIIENAYLYFDFVAPMVYPSHYASGVFGFKNPAEHPYEVIKNSMDSAYLRLKATSTLGIPYVAKLRPWIQDFDLGAEYDEVKVKAQIQATGDSLGSDYVGYMVWSPSNKYSDGAFITTEN